MALTFATPNGGNSQKTGTRNVNNSAAATAATSSWGNTYASPNEQRMGTGAATGTYLNNSPADSNTTNGGNNDKTVNTVYPSPNEQVIGTGTATGTYLNNSPADSNTTNGGNNNKTTTVVPTVPTVPYASPYEQGNGLGPEWNGLLSVGPSLFDTSGDNGSSSSNTTTTPVVTPATTTALPATANITDDSLDAWLASFEEDFDLKTGLTNQSIQDNTDQLTGVNKDLSSLFFEQRNQGDQIDATNLNVDDVTTDLSNTDSTVGEVKSELSDQQSELLALESTAKNLGLSLVDAEGVQVDIQRDIIDNADKIKQGQNSDLVAKTALENQIKSATDSVGVLSDDANDDFSFDPDDSFNLVVDGQNILGEELVESGFSLDNIVSTVGSKTTDTDKTDNVQRYNQEYWASQLKELKNDPATAASAQTIVNAQIEELGKGAYSGAVITTDDQHFNANESLMALNSQLTGIDSAVGLGASPNAPPEYILEATLTNIDQWVADGKMTVSRETSGIFDENTTSTYTIVDEDLNSKFSTSYGLGDNGMELVVKSTNATIKIGDEVISLGNDTDTLFVNGIGIGTAAYQGTGSENGLGSGVGGDGDVVTIDLIGAGEIGAAIEDDDIVVPPPEDPPPPPPEDPPPPPPPPPEDPEDPEEDPEGDGEGDDGLPLPDDDGLPDPNGTGAFGTDGNEFTLDGVTFWKRVKDRNGRWTYVRVDNYQSNGTSSRRGNWGAVQNF